jgi:hypothetical protein
MTRHHSFEEKQARSCRFCSQKPVRREKITDKRLAVKGGEERLVPSKPLTLDFMKTLDLFLTRACYH